MCELNSVDEVVKDIQWEGVAVLGDGVGSGRGGGCMVMF